MALLREYDTIFDRAGLGSAARRWSSITDPPAPGLYTPAFLMCEDRGMKG
jgi:hypothetical protein